MKLTYSAIYRIDGRWAAVTGFYPGMVGVGKAKYGSLIRATTRSPSSSVLPAL